MQMIARVEMGGASASHIQVSDSGNPSLTHQLPPSGEECTSATAPEMIETAENVVAPEQVANEPAQAVPHDPHLQQSAVAEPEVEQSDGRKHQVAAQTQPEDNHAAGVMEPEETSKTEEIGLPQTVERIAPSQEMEIDPNIENAHQGNSNEATALQDGQAQGEVNQVASPVVVQRMGPSSSHYSYVESMQVPAPVSDASVPQALRLAPEATENIPLYEQAATTVHPIVTGKRRGSERYHPSPAQLKSLTDSFEENPNPPVATLNYLSENINMPMHNIVLWFKNRRARSKKNVRIPGQRRSYVKSGTYARARRLNMPRMDNVPLPPVPIVTPSIVSPAIVAPQEPVEQLVGSQVAPEAEFESGPTEFVPPVVPIITSVPNHSPPSPTNPPSPKRPRYFPVDVDEELGTLNIENPCRSWSAPHCLQIFTHFFAKHTEGRREEQAKIAQEIATDFFIAENHSGLTVSSSLQPIKKSLGILEAIIERRKEKDLPQPCSGTVSILGEYLVQLRSGEAASLGEGGESEQ